MNSFAYYNSVCSNDYVRSLQVVLQQTDGQ